MDGQLVEKLGQRLLPWMDQLSSEQLNPSIYVGLRLSSMQAGTKENLYLHNLKLHYQQCLLRYYCSLVSRHILSSLSLAPPAECRDKWY